LRQNSIEPIFIGEQIVSPLLGKRHEAFVDFLVRQISVTIENFEKAGVGYERIANNTKNTNLTLNSIECIHELNLKSDYIKLKCSNRIQKILFAKS
jgi:hypothetical protein